MIFNQIINSMFLKKSEVKIKTFFFVDSLKIKIIFWDNEKHYFILK
jgi:hypothetical protein